MKMMHAKAGRLSATRFAALSAAARRACRASALALTLAIAGCGSDSSADSTQGAGGSNDDAGLSDASGDILATADAFHDGSDNEGSSGDGSCGGQAVVAERVPVNLLVVIDRSGSMTQTPSGFTSSKWDSLVAALKSSLAGLEDKMAVGLVFFPDPASSSADGCGMPLGDSVLVDIGPGQSTVPLIQVMLDDDSSKPAGNTPAANALALAHRYFTTGAGAQLAGAKHVLLALDGGPNCNATISCDAASCTVNVDRSASDPAKSACPIDPASCCGDGADPELNKSCLDDDGTVAQVSALADIGVSTFVVGIPGSDLFAGVLDALAVAGGHAVSATSPKYFEVTDAQELTDTLQSITTNLVKACEFQLNSTPPDADKVNVFIDGQVVPKDGPDGWEYDNSTTPPTIVIKGATCDALQSEGAQSVSFEFGCPTVK